MRQLFVRLFVVLSSVGLVIGIVQLFGWTALLICPALALATLVFSSGPEHSGGKRTRKALRLQLTVPGGLQ